MSEDDYCFVFAMLCIGVALGVLIRSCAMLIGVLLR